MKHRLTLPICLLAALAFTNPPGSLIGRWQQKIQGGVTAQTVYRTDDTFDVFLNGKIFASGKYTLKGGTLAMSDPVCGVGYYGTYQLTFITPDSVRQTPISDTCQGRREFYTSSPTIGRIKPTKP